MIVCVKAMAGGGAASRRFGVPIVANPDAMLRGIYPLRLRQ
jgi:hypothetical protein